MISLHNDRIQLYHGDCLGVMPTLPAQSIDMILADLPYGTTQNKWDSIIDLSLLWKEYKRVRVNNAAIALTAQTPFDKVLGVSNLDELRYDWIWNKVHTTNYANAKKMPLKQHENIVIFYKQLPVYNPQMIKRDKVRIRKGKSGSSDSVCKTEYNDTRVYDEWYPKSIIEFSNADHSKHYHPTQKPVALMEYLIKTYTNENDLVLDNTMGSGTTGVACINTNRRFVGIEMDQTYFDIAVNRCQDAIRAYSENK